VFSFHTRLPQRQMQLLLLPLFMDLPAQWIVGPFYFGKTIPHATPES